MAITLLFEPKAGADVQYDSVINALKDQGMWPPEGLTYHVASGMGADFKVFEVWESEQRARNFGERLKPVEDGVCTLEVPFRQEWERPGGIVSGIVFMTAANTIKGKSL